MAAPTVPFPRTLTVGVTPGEDVIGVKRAVSRAGFWPWSSEFTDVYTAAFAKGGVKAFQKGHGLTVDGIYGPVTHEHLRLAHLEGSATAWAFDPVAARLMRNAANEALTVARKMLAYCRRFTGPYGYGAEHDSTLADDNLDGAFDCSSSTSKMLYEFDLLGSTFAHDSSWFRTWGLSGRGRYVTVHANADHVWTEFDLPEGYFRFDTSPHGDGPRGARVRTRKRSDSGFTHRHPKGM